MSENRGQRRCGDEKGGARKVKAKGERDLVLTVEPVPGEEHEQQVDVKVDPKPHGMRGHE